MPPRRKAAPKAKTADDVPVANFTARRPVVNDNESGTEENEESQQLLNSAEKMSNMNVTILLENLPHPIVGMSSESKSESELVDDKEEKLNKKPVQKKMPKEKSKLKKQILEDSKEKKIKTRASSAENQRPKVEEKVVGSKNRKRPIEKGDIMEPSKLVSPINDQPKRNRRACSVDISSSHTTISVQRSKQINKDNEEIEAENEIVDEVPKKLKKKVKKGEEPSKLPGKNLKIKKDKKKIVTAEKENSPTPEQNIELLSAVQEKPKSRKGAKKEQINVSKEEQTAVIKEEEKINKQSSKNRAAPKNQVDKKILDKKCDLKITPSTISPEKSDETSEKNDTDSILKTPELQTKQNQRGKQINVSTEKSEESSSKNDTDDSAIISPPEIQQKRGRYKKQQTIVDEKDIKVPKRGGRRVKGEDFEEVVQKSPPLEDGLLVEAGDVADGSPDTPESGKNETKPVVIKRKIKTKTTKK